MVKTTHAPLFAHAFLLLFFAISLLCQQVMNIYVKVLWGSIGHAVWDCLGKDVMMMSGNVTMRTMSYISFLLSSYLLLFFLSLNLVFG